MQTNRRLQDSLNWASPYLNYLPVTIGGLDPALTIGNLILQTILGPPFLWRFNRNTVQFTCTITDQDYKVAAADFGHVEKAILQSADGKTITELEYKRSLAPTKEKDRPAFINDFQEYAPDNASKTLTLRLNMIPDETYLVTVLYQMKAPILTSMASRWRPIPDEYSYIYDWGFLALAQMLNEDSRFPISLNNFVAHLLGAQQGLDESERNIFLGNWLEITRQFSRSGMATQQGVAARQR